jgi:hypothetical protein
MPTKVGDRRFWTGKDIAAANVDSLRAPHSALQTKPTARRRELLSDREGDVLSAVLDDPAMARASDALAAFTQADISRIKKDNLTRPS